MRDEGRSAEGTRLLIVIDPTVHARAVEYVLAVRHAPDFLLRPELVKAHGARRRRGGVGEVGEGRDGEEVPDEERGERGGARRGGRGRGLGPGGVGVEEVGEAEQAEEGEDEGAEAGEEGERVEEEVWDQHFRVPYGETHRRRVGVFLHALLLFQWMR
uniref:Uncharacterized protein n=1 Tax=Cajanus cajan TaxID=3821 RepID=A0A151TB54_CAJCA|nr:hypothetical protein KK1_018825 [Cajanus cajan]